jgi:hypothetical protein
MHVFSTSLYSIEHFCSFLHSHPVLQTHHAHPLVRFHFPHVQFSEQSFSLLGFVILVVVFNGPHTYARNIACYIKAAGCRVQGAGCMNECIFVIAEKSSECIPYVFSETSIL